MAKVKFSAFISDVRGRLDDEVFSFCSPTHYKKSYQPVVANPNTSRQVYCRTQFSAIAKKWYYLTPIQQEMWTRYAGMHKSVMHGQNGFCKLNNNLAGACHTDLVCIYLPPKFPSTPEFPYGLCVYPMSSILTCITWLRPLDSDLYVMAFFHLHKSFCSHFPSYSLCLTVGYRPDFRFIATTRSDNAYILHHHTWPSGCRLFYKLRSIDKFGRVSPWTHQTRMIVP